MTIPFNQTYISPNAFELYKLILQSGAKHSGDGYYNKKCSEWLKSQLSTVAAFLTPSCTSAMEFAYLLIDLKPGDEVIMPSFTFTSTATAVTLFGGVPVFVDVDDSLNIDLSKLDSALSNKTKAVCAVHYAGQSCQMNELKSWSKKNNIFLIEDAAQALMAKYDGKFLGTFGDLAAFSFHETKNIICGEGGALIVNNAQLVARAEILRDKGSNRQMFLRGEVDKYTWQDKGSSYLIPETAACLLYSQFLEAEKITTIRRQIVNRYLEKINDCSDFKVMKKNSFNVHNGHLFYILCKNESVQNALQLYMKTLGVQLVTHYVPLHDSPAGLRFSRSSGSMNRTSTLAQCLLRLPVFFELSEIQQNRIIEGLNDFRS